MAAAASDRGLRAEGEGEGERDRTMRCYALRSDTTPHAAMLCYARRTNEGGCR